MSKTQEASLEEQQQPLLEDEPTQAKPEKTPAQKAIRKTFKGTAHLANLLPTGSVLAFQVLSPILTHEGQCRSIISQYLTLTLVGLCGASCFILCFTDSFRDQRGKVRYGVATFHGIWVIDASPIVLPPDEAVKYRIKLMDFFHGVLSILVFGAIALFNQNVVNCFYPMPSEEAQDILTALPVGVGLICSLLFLIFPSRRHGIGFPLSRN